LKKARESFRMNKRSWGSLPWNFPHWGNGSFFSDYV